MGYKASIRLRPDTTLRIFKARNVPYSFREKVQFEIDRLTREGILEKIEEVSEPITWASPIVCIEKRERGIRICGDYKITINKHMDFLPYPLPTFKNVMAVIKGGQKILCE
ncbi:hypothetical protein RF11_01332 [Thelohanellus kitauei]|uniref:Uncharacterized protein n=1 Tax=Thelohanellus kitauei TaxID=669202 RepID=A0A0C2N7X7_THEKT|nr:hypothetical protein RF11_01332 [Thelohanellus kitauei]